MKCRRTPGTVVFDWCNGLILALFALICVYPFYYMLCYAFSDPGEAMKGISLAPRGFTLENFRAVAELGTIPQAAFISVFRTAAGS